MDYAGWITAVATLLEYPIVNAASSTPTGTAFDQVWPRAVEYTELRLQRDVDFLASVVTDDTGQMSQNSRLITFPAAAGHFVVVSQVIPFLNGVRQLPLEPVSRAFLDFAFPSDVSPGQGILPRYWAPRDEFTALVAPPPAQNLGFETVGTMRFVPLSATATSNFLTLYLPDLYVAASMIWFSGYQRDFGQQSDDPTLAQSWESQYGKLLSSAQTEEARKKFADIFPRASNPIGVTAQAA